MKPTPLNKENVSKVKNRPGHYTLYNEKKNLFIMVIVKF